MLANWKPAKGSYRLAQREQRAKVRTAEVFEKRAAKRRDGGQCRYPGCDWQKKGFALQQLIRSERRKLIAVCFMHHEGPCSLHSGDIRIVPVFPEQGTSGPCTFYRLDEQKGWMVDGIN